MHFLKTVFFAGHVLALPLAELERLGKTVRERLAARRATTIEPGVDLVGFAYGEFGLAESLRALARACLAGDIPFGVKDVDLRLKTRQADRSIAAHVTDTLKHRCSVFCLNPDTMKPVRSLLVEGAAMGRHNVGYWFWELEQLPREWDYAIAAVDEIWVSTQFIADAVRRATPKPVVLIPAPIDVTPSRPYTRAEFGLADDRFLFLFSFDFNSFASPQESGRGHRGVPAGVCARTAGRRARDQVDQRGQQSREDAGTPWRSSAVTTASPSSTASSPAIRFPACRLSSTRTCRCTAPKGSGWGSPNQCTRASR